MTTPRLRSELLASPVEEDGFIFFDVSDPRSGVTMRLYDFEWLLATQLDGRRDIDTLAHWAKDALQLEVDPQQLGEFAGKLGELGFFEEPGEPAFSESETVRVEKVGDSPVEAVAEPTPEPVDEPAPPTSEDELVAVDPDDMAIDMDSLPTTQVATLPPATFNDERTETTVRAPAPPELLESTRSPQPAVPTPAPVEAPIAVESPAKPSSSGSLFGLVLVLLVVAAIVVYVTKHAPSAAKVSIVVANPAEVVRTYEGTSKLEAAPAQTLSFGEPGKVLDVVAAGTVVKTGVTIATLDGYTKIEKELADVKDRLGFYQKQLDAATAKNDENAKKAAQGKVDEKKKLLTDLDARAGKLRLVAPGPGMVEKVQITAGSDVKPGVAAVELTDKRMLATFKVPASAGLKTGDSVTLQRASGGGVAEGKVEKTEEGSVVVEVADGEAGGDVRLVKSRLPGVITLPASAVVQKNGADVVYTLAAGAVHEKKVTLLDRTPTEVYVSGGVGRGESVVTTGGSTLMDGQKAVVAQ